MDIQSLGDEAARLRGSFIQYHTFLEKWLQSYVAVHFCDDPNKANEFLEYVICQHIPFDKTREIFVFLLKNHRPDLLSKYKQQVGYISSINEERNIVGHYLLDTSTEAAEQFKEKGIITFVKFKNGVSREFFDLQRITEFMRKNEAVRVMIDEIHPILNIEK